MPEECKRGAQARRIVGVHEKWRRAAPDGALWGPPGVRSERRGALVSRQCLAHDAARLRSAALVVPAPSRLCFTKVETRALALPGDHSPTLPW